MVSRAGAERRRTAHVKYLVLDLLDEFEEHLLVDPARVAGPKRVFVLREGVDDAATGCTKCRQLISINDVPQGPGGVQKRESRGRVSLEYISPHAAEWDNAAPRSNKHGLCSRFQREDSVWSANVKQISLGDCIAQIF